MTRPSPDLLLGETARLAFHLHWPLDTILDLEHADRRRFLAEVDALSAAAHGPVGSAKGVSKNQQNRCPPTCPTVTRTPAGAGNS